MTAEKEKAIDKIKKLLALSSSSNENEAEQAMALAMKFAAGIGMDLKDIGELEQKDQTIAEVCEMKNRKNVPIWEQTLAGQLAFSLGCKAILRQTAETQIVCLIGYKSDTELFWYLFPHIVSQLRRLCKRDKEDFERNNAVRVAFWGETNWKKFERNWYQGAAIRCGKMAKEKFVQETTKEEQEQYAIVVSDKRSKIDEWTKQNIQLEDGKAHKQKIDDEMASIGYRSAGSVSFSKGIEQEFNQRLEA